MGPISFAILAASQAAGPVTYHCRAEKIPIVLADLSKQTGVRLVSRDEASDEVILLNVQSLPLTSLLKKIATVTSCEWEKNSNGFTLRPSPSIRQKEQEAELKARADAIQGYLQWQLEVVEKHMEPSNFSACRFAALKLLQTLPPLTLAALEDQREYCFTSAEPNPRQTALPPESNDIIASWIHSIVSDRPLPPVTTCLLTVQVDQRALSVEAKCTDSDGKVVLTGSGEIDQAFVEGKDDPNDRDTHPTVPLSFTEDSDELQRIISSPRDHQRRMPPASKELRQKLLKPETFEPLSLCASDLIECYRKNGHPQIIADVPDRLFTLSTLPTFHNPDPLVAAASAMHAIKSSGVFIIHVEDSVALLKPDRPAASRLERMNRSDFGELLRSCTDPGRPSIESLSAYALNNPDFNHTPIASQYLSLMKSGYPNSGYQSPWLGYRFYGSLSPDQQQDLLSGNSIPFASLSPSQREQGAEMLYSTQAPIMPLIERGPMNPTLAIPNGLTNGVLRIVKNSFLMGSFDPKGGATGGYLMSPEQYGQMLGTYQSNPALKLPSTAMAGDHLDLAIIFQLGQDKAAVAHIEGFEYPPGSKYAPVDQLPTDFLARANQIAEAVKKNAAAPRYKPPGTP